jgi:hypothetical protein
MQLRRLDPLANAGPYQKLMRNPAKSFSLSEAQFERITQERRDLVASEGEAMVIGFPLRDFLEVHYAFPDVEAFVERFPRMLEKVVAGSSKQEAPRGLLLSFRDRPNRMTADTVFWSVAMDQGEQWVEMNLVAVPEQAEPANDLGDYKVVEVDGSNEAEAVDLEAQATGLPALSPSGFASLRENSKALRLAQTKTGEAAGLLSVRTEPGGWGVIDLCLVREGADDLRLPLLNWAVAWLRNYGGRRTRTRVGVDDSAMLTALKSAGFTPGEIGLYFRRTVDKAETDAKMEERRAHGTIIKFGDWR